MLVTNIVGTTATITRGQDGTTAMSHAAGATFDQTVVRQDLDEANAHTSASSGVHGISGSVVGTTDAQTLTNKTLTGPVVNGFTGTGNGTVTGNLNVSGTLTSGAHTASSESVTGNATVGGTLGVTGVLTATAGVVDGTDTGWVNLITFQNGFVAQSPAPQARQIGNKVYLRGALSNSTLNTATYTTGCVLPSGIAKPASAPAQLNVPNTASGGVNRFTIVDASGNVQFANSGGANSSFWHLDGGYYFTDS